MSEPKLIALEAELAAIKNIGHGEKNNSLIRKSTHQRLTSGQTVLRWQKVSIAQTSNIGLVPAHQDSTRDKRGSRVGPQERDFFRHGSRRPLAGGQSLVSHVLVGSRGACVARGARAARGGAWAQRRCQCPGLAPDARSAVRLGWHPGGTAPASSCTPCCPAGRPRSLACLGRHHPTS